MDAISRVLYNTVFRRNSTYLAFIVAGGFGAERVINRGGDYVWDEINKGVRFFQDLSWSSRVCLLTRSLIF
jgi:hypothetical protein